MASTAIKYAGSGIATGTSYGGVTWSNVDNALGAPNTTIAFSTLGEFQVSEGYYAYRFDFDGVSGVPEGATIDGIELVIRKSRTPSLDREIKDGNLRLASDITTYVGSDKADTSTVWATSLTDATYGGAVDTWSWGAASAAAIRASGFGVVFVGAAGNGTAFTNADANVDSFGLRIYYTEGSPTPPPAPGIAEYLYPVIDQNTGANYVSGHQWKTAPFWSKIDEGVFSPNDADFVQPSSITHSSVDPTLGWESAELIVIPSGSTFNDLDYIYYARLDMRFKVDTDINQNDSGIIQKEIHFGSTAINLRADHFTQASGVARAFQNYSWDLTGDSGLGYIPVSSSWNDMCYGTMLLSDCTSSSIIENFKLSALQIYISGAQIVETSSGIPFYMSGHLGCSGDIPFSMYGIPAGTSGTQAALPLYIQGHTALTSGIDMYMYGVQPVTSSVPMFLKVSDVASGTLNMFLMGQTATSGTETIPFYTYATSVGTSGTQGSVPMFLGSENFPGTINLMLRGPDSAETTKTINLYIGGTIKTADAQVPFYLENFGTESSIPFYMAGKGIDEFDVNLPGGGLPGSGGINMFLLCPGESNTIPFYLHNQTVSSGIDMYIDGVFTNSGSIPFVMPVTQDSLSDTLKLFTHGF